MTKLTPDQTLPEAGGRTAGSVEVHEHGAGNRLAGPGTGRAISQPADARPERPISRDPETFGIPTGREEQWRFTPLDRLGGLLRGEEADGKDDLTVDHDGQARRRTVPVTDPLVGRVLVPADVVAAHAMTKAPSVDVWTVPAGARLDKPLELNVHGFGGARYTHTIIEIEPQAEATVLLSYSGTAAYAANLEVIVGDNAALTLVSVQDWDDTAIHVGAQAALVGRDARFRHIVATLGGDLVRLSPTVRFAGPGGDAELLGLYFADAGQHLEHRLLVDHAVPYCRSRVAYKGALQGEGAHTVWIGDVLIRAVAEGTDTYELNRNLILTDGARADSVPNLEIETGEIAGAGHASATGRFDDEQLFYLCSRGISPKEARRLVVRGFFAEVINQIGIPELSERLITKIEAELEGAVS